jgi:U3 small nucleolar RNA-associated protein MPP10
MSAADDQDEYYKELIPLVNTVKTRPEVFATGDYGVRDSALVAEKFVFDYGMNMRPCLEFCSDLLSAALSLESTALQHINPLVQSFHDYEAAPRTRSRTKAAADSQAEQKPAPPRPPIPLFSHTPLDSLYMDGMNSEQIWEQIELKTKNVLKVLEAIVTPETDFIEGSVGEQDVDMDEESGEFMGEQLDMDLDLDDSDLDDSSADSDYVDDGSPASDDDGAAGGEEDSAGHGEESIAPLQPGMDERPELELDRRGLSPAVLKR